MLQDGGDPQAAVRYTVALFVPGDRPERFEKAIATGADLVILDLEDAVAADRKDVARESVRAALAAGLRASVRVHAPASEAGRRDLAALAGTCPVAIVLAKTASPDEPAAVNRFFPNVAIVPLIESVAGIRHIEPIAAAPGVEALAFGGYDLCAELGARATPEVLASWRALLVLAARGAGRQAIDTPYLVLDDEAGLAADARRAVDFGFDGKLAVHPRQVAVIRAAFRPDPAELARAHGILETAARGGVAVYQGTMIDGPMVLAARRVLARGGE